MADKRDFYTVNVWKIQISRRVLVLSAYYCWKILLSVYSIKYHKLRLNG